MLRLLKRVRQITISASTWIVGRLMDPRFRRHHTVAVAMSSGTGTIAAENMLMAFEPRCVLIVGLAIGLGI